MSDPGRMYLYSPPEANREQRQEGTASGGANGGTTNRAGGILPSRLLARSRRSPLGGGAEAAEPSHASATETWTSAAGNGGRGGGGAGDAPPAALGRWDAALGNVSDASVTLQQLKHAIDDAVYLDEDAYNGVASLSHYNKTIQAQQRRIVELEHELEMALGGKEKAEARASAEAKRRRDAEERRDAIETELENNAGDAVMGFPIPAGVACLFTSAAPRLAQHSSAQR